MSGQPVYDEAAAEAEFEREMAATSTVYGLRPGHTLTQADYEAIQLYDRVSRRDQQQNIDAFNSGYQAGLRDGGSADIAEMDSRLSRMLVNIGVEKMMRRLADQRADAILAALVGVMDILGRAESDASGTPEFDHVGPRVAEARAIVEQYADKAEPDPARATPNTPDMEKVKP